jgi:sulfhydrogenase subunit beta (sulfur reductase)
LLYKVIDKPDLEKLFNSFVKSQTVIAPVKAGKSYSFAEVHEFGEVELDYSTTLTSLKKFFIPKHETLFEFDGDGEIHDCEIHPRKRVLFGAHACDINAINNLNLIFEDQACSDPYYKKRKSKTMIVGISCMPTETCFCHNLGVQEAKGGYDLFLQDLGDRYFVSIGSVEGADVLEEQCSPRNTTDDDRKLFLERARLRQEAFSKEVPEIQEIPMLMDAFHADPFWEEMGSKCLSCTACARVCPTCYCFNIVDSFNPDGVGGKRERFPDCCTNPEFAQVTGGFNFRDSNVSRVSHRMYHKLNGFYSKHDRYLCVGCGRCARACKAGISPIEVLKFFANKEFE